MTIPTALSTALLVAVLAAGCGGSDARPRPVAASGTRVGSTAPAGPASPTTVASTPDLDSIVAMGHSGITGADSDPQQPMADDARNSWATGDNPDVHSIYQRLLATHPALEGHETDLGEDGSTVDALVDQTTEMLQLVPLPDVVLVQTIDNDVQCDGTDTANQRRFARTVDGVLTTIATHDPDAQVFFVDVWGTAEEFAEAALTNNTAFHENVGTGPCDLYNRLGKVRLRATAHLQHIVDGYFAQLVTVCRAHPNCWTDGGALRAMTLSPRDLSTEGGHLSIAGHAHMADLAWAALPDAIKSRA